jgi:hypothetical protein
LNDGGIGKIDERIELDGCDGTRYTQVQQTGIVGLKNGVPQKILDVELTAYKGKYLVNIPGSDGGLSAKPKDQEERDEDPRFFKETHFHKYMFFYQTPVSLQIAVFGITHAGVINPGKGFSLIYHTLKNVKWLGGGAKIWRKFSTFVLRFMKIGLRFFLSWILSAVTMFILFYIWHGVFLNDFKRIQFPVSWFITFAALSYLIFGAGIYFLFESSIMKKFENLFLRGLVSGVIAGFSLFMIATVVNISITKHLSMGHLMLDCAWQIGEQTIGVMVVVLLKVLVREPQFEEL